MDFDPKDAKNLRVLLATPSMQIADGVSITIRKIHKRVKHHGGEIRIFTAIAAKEYFEKEEPELFKDMLFGDCFSISYDHTTNYSIMNMLTKQTKKLILDFKPNVFHYTSPDIFGFSIGEWTRKNNKPVIATWHSNIPDYLDHTSYFARKIIKPILIFVFRAVYKYPLVTYVPTEAMRTHLAKQGYLRLRVWGRGVNVELFSPKKRNESLRTKLGIKKEQIVILWVGRCVKEKRHDIFIEVLKRLENKYPSKVIGLVVGKGKNYDEMVGLDNCIGFGWANREKVAEIYASSDLLLFPSGVETFGNVTLEGMASGIPVVGDNICSKHLIQDNITGFACSQFPIKDQNGREVDCYTQYFEACEKIVVNDDLRIKLGQQGRDIAVKKWEIKDIIDEMVAHYIETMQLGKDKKVPNMKYSMDQYIARILFEVGDKSCRIIEPLLSYLSFNQKDVKGESATFMICIFVLFIGLIFVYINK